MNSPGSHAAVTSEEAVVRIGSGSLVLVEDAAKDIAARDLVVGDRNGRVGDRQVELQSPVWPCFVVMVDVLGKNHIEMSP